MKKISIYNNKGGVGKTTSVTNIAYAMHKADKKVLVVDCDTQKNCFTFFEMSKKKFENITNITYVDYNNLDNAEKEKYDYVLFDLPPVLSSEVKQILDNSDKVYVPLMLRQFEILGLRNVTQACGSKLGGIFITMHKKGKKDTEIFNEIKSVLGERVMETTIPYAESIINSQREMLPVEEYFVESGIPQSFKNCWKIADTYKALAEEIMEGVQ